MTVFGIQPPGGRILLLLGCLLALARICIANPTPTPTPTPCSASGALDTTFNGTGKVTTSIRGINDQAYSVAIQADGKIVAAGFSYSPVEFALVRYNTDGSLDTTFNGTGTVTTSVLGVEAEALSVAIQTDGKIVAAGWSNTGSRYEFALVRYNTNGSLDTTFNGTGLVTTTIRGINDEAYSVAIQADGKIVAAGFSYNNNYDPAFALARYNNDGSLDTTFNGTGLVTTTVLGMSDVARSVAIQADGKIVAAGNAYTGSTRVFGLVRLNTNGSLDTTFNGTGKVTTTVLGIDDEANSVAIQTDGKIVAAGFSHYNFTQTQFAVVRYDTNGNLDTTFGGTGKVTTTVGDSAGAASVAIQTDGKIVAAGSSSSLAANSHFALVRYNTNGSLDTTFGGTGKVTTPIGVIDAASSVVIQADGKIVAAGYSHNGQFYEFAVVRYAADQCGGPTPTPTRAKISGGNILIGSPGQGILMRSPSGNVCALISIDDQGNLVSTPTTCPASQALLMPYFPRFRVRAELAELATGWADCFVQSGSGAVFSRFADDDQQGNPINNRAFVDAEYNRSFVCGEYGGFSNHWYPRAR